MSTMSEDPLKSREVAVYRSAKKAEAAMREDETVQSLLADFDGKLEEVHLH